MGDAKQTVEGHSIPAKEAPKNRKILKIKGQQNSTKYVEKQHNFTFSVQFHTEKGGKGGPKGGKGQKGKMKNFFSLDPCRGKEGVWRRAEITPHHQPLPSSDGEGKVAKKVKKATPPPSL